MNILDKLNTKCCKCDTPANICELYKYEDKIYCCCCLTEKLEEDDYIHTDIVTVYYDSDGYKLGDSDDFDEIMDELCNSYEIERVCFNE